MEFRGGVFRFWGGLAKVLIHDTGDIDSLVLLRIARIRMGGQAHAAEIRHDDRVVLDEHLRQRRPHVARVAEAVQQDDRRPLPSDANMKTGAVGLHHLRAESRRKVLDPRDGGRGQSRRNGNGYACKQRSAQQPKTSDSCDRIHMVISTLSEEKLQTKIPVKPTYKKA